MNGFFIFNAVMLLLCIINWFRVETIGNASNPIRLMMLFFVFLTALITALSYGNGPLSGA